MRRAGSSAPLLTFCPGTFSAVCLSCGRTLLVLLAVLPAVLRSIFAAFTIVLLISLLTVTAEGQGVTATLPETMTEDSVIDFVMEQEISTVEAFIQALPPLHKRHFVAVHDSASPAADFISTSHPRIISWGADAGFVVTWTTNPEDPDSDNVEFLQPVPAEGRWIAGVIDFSGESPQLRHPEACAQCHGDLRKPLWGADDVHDGTEGETLSRTLSEEAVALHRAMSASTHPRLTSLELNGYQNAPRTIGFANRERQIPTWEFALVLALRHSEVLFNRFRVRQDYDQLSGSVVCSSSITDLERKIRSEFDQADYNIRLLSNTLEPVQGENSLTHIVAGEYKGGDATLSTTIGFLIFHNLWQRFESVRDLYRGTSNEHALGTLEFAPGFREMLLRYAIGQATVEDELVAAYHEFFELRGQASIDDRALRPINPRYGGSFPDYHVGHFHDRVCSALSRNEGVIPPPPPPPPGGGGFGGGGGGGSRTTAPAAPSNLTAVGGDGEAVLTWDAPSRDGGAEITDYEYRIDRRNPWISIGSTNTTHTLTGLVNGTAYVFEVRAVNRIGTSFASRRAEATPEAPEVFTLDFAHFANGTSITSDLVFVNLAPQPVRPAIYFYDTEGALVSAESVVEVTGDLEITEDGSLTVRTEMEPLGELTISTHGQGEVVTGSVKAVSEGPIGGGVRYNLPAIGEAVVRASPPVSDALFPVRRREGGITTGVAIHNLEEEPMGVSCRLMSAGVVLEETSIPLAANGQTSWLIDAAFPAADTSGFTGSVRCDVLGQGRFTAVALEMDPATRIFITLPVVDVDRGGGGREAVLDFAHFANGDGTTSDLVFVNMKTEPSGPAPTPFHVAIPPIRPAIYFYDTEGALVSAESVVDVTGDLEITEDGGLTVQTQMEPLGVLTISTHGQGALVTGSVKVISDGPIGGMLRYNLPAIGVAVVGASPPLGDAIFPVRRQEGGINTGVAIHNLESSPGLVRCDLMREGVLSDAVSIPLEANGQTSWLLGQKFPAADTSDFTGSVRCDAVGEGRFSAVALEMDPATRTFTTLPVFPVPERASQE